MSLNKMHACISLRNQASILVINLKEIHAINMAFKLSIALRNGETVPVSIALLHKIGPAI
jgi:hypothetical protein